MLRARLYRAVILFCASLLAACGGGGGGGSSGPSYTVSPTNITFTATEGQGAPAAQVSTISVSGGTVYIDYEQTGSFFYASFSITGATTAALTITPVAPTLAPGTYVGSVAVLGCNDSACHSPVAGSPKVVNVTYTVQPRTGLKVAPTSLSFTQLEGGPAPAAQTFTLSEYSTASYPWNASISYQSGSDWLRINGSTTASGTSLPATPSVTIQPPATSGSYSAVIHLSGNGNSVDLPVTYTLRQPQIATPSPASLTFSAFPDGSTPAGQAVTLATESSVPVSYSAAVVYGPGATGWLTTPASGSAPGNVNIAVNTTALALGTYTAMVVLSTATQNVSIGVTYTVREPTLTAAPGNLSFAALRYGDTPTGQNIALTTEASEALDYSASIAYGPGASGWLTVPASGTAPESVTASVNTTHLAAGSYSATVTFTTAGQSRSVGVTYQVSNPSLTFDRSSLSYTLDRASLPAAFNGAVAVGDTNAAMAWSASPSVSWLAATPASGTTAGDGSTQNVSITLVPGELEKLDPGVHSGNVVFSYTRLDATVATATLPVTLNLNMPRLNFVAPYVVLSGAPVSVVVRGKGFTGLSASDVEVGAAHPSSLDVVSDSEMNLSMGSMTAASYTIDTPNAAGLDRSNADLVVIDPVVRAGTSFVSSGAKSRAIFDDERGAAYVVNMGAATIERYVYTAASSSWSFDSLSLPALRDAALSPDGAALVAASDTAVRLVDPVALSESDALAFSHGTTVLNQLAFANDGVAILATRSTCCTGYFDLYQYDLVSNAITPVKDPYPLNSQYNAYIDAAAVGSRVLINQMSGDLRYYDASTGFQVVTALSGTGARVASDRRGTRMIFGARTVRDVSFAVLGNLPNTGAAAIVSPAGDVAYTYDRGVVRKFDLTAALVAGEFPEIGTGTAVLGGAVSTSVPYPPYVSWPPAMAISADGETLVIGGDLRVAIMPAP